MAWWATESNAGIRRSHVGIALATSLSMEPYPHLYRVQATSQATERTVTVGSEGVPTLTTAPPAQFGGPGDRWSPEGLLVAAAADCFVLTFRALAAGAKLQWKHLTCDAEGVLDRREGRVRFTELRLHARLVVGDGVDAERARRLLDKAESACLITNSLSLRATLAAEVTVEV